MKHTDKNSVERSVENDMLKIANKNKAKLNAALIEPLSKDWKFSTNGLYLLLATAGCGKSRFIIKHILMSERLFKEPYYSLIVYCSTSGELDKTVETYINSKQIKTPLIMIPDDKLLAFLDRHLKRKTKYYAMIEFIRSNCKNINKTLQHSIDKHNFKILIKHTDKTTGIETFVEKVNKPVVLNWIISKMISYDVNKPVLPLLVVLDDFAGNKLIERKESPLAKMMTKCRHYSTTFIIAVQTAKYVIKNIRRQATDIVIWSGLNEEDFFALLKEIQYSYNKYLLWNEYRMLKNQRDYLILNIKAHDYKFITS